MWRRSCGNKGRRRFIRLGFSSKERREKRGRHPCFLEFDPEPNGILSLAGESKLAFFFQILLLLLQSLHTCRFELSSFSIEIFKIYAVIGIWMKESKLAFFFQILLLPLQGLLGTLIDLNDRNFEIYAVIGIWMKENTKLL